jgi:hypothetical protein
MVTKPFPSGQRPGSIALLTDGRVLLSGPETSNQWWTFSPDASGSYQNGSFAPVSSSPLGRWAHPAFMLRDGRFWTGGGEYQGPNEFRCAQTDCAENEVYDPVADSWTVLPDMPGVISDSPTALLGNGEILVLSQSSNETFLLTSFGVPPSWSPAAAWSPTIGDTESSSQILQDGSVIAGSRQFQRWLPASGSWVDTALPPLGAGSLVASGSDEMGAIVLLHDGRALVLGSSSHNGLYTPPADGGSGPGTWTAAANTPQDLAGTGVVNHGDSPAVVEPNGKALTVVTNDATGLGFATAIFYEYDPAADSWAFVDTVDANNNRFTFDNAERVFLLMLPNGQVWASGSGSPNAWLYTPAGGPETSWQPSINSVSAPNFGAFQVTGVNLNGLTTGGDWGDDNKQNTNYPIVSLVDGAGNVTYGRSFNFDQMAPLPNHTGSFSFTVPESLPDGTYSLNVSANGVSSSGVPLSLTFAGAHVSSLAGDAKQSPGLVANETVTIADPAPAGGAQIEIGSTPPGVAEPLTGTIPEGQTSATFQVPVLAYGKTTLQAASAANGRFVRTLPFGWTLTSLSGPSTADPNGDGVATWTVAIDSAAITPGVVVNLLSSNIAAATVPATVTIPTGQTSVTFPVTIVGPSAGPSTITASMVNTSQAASFQNYALSSNSVSPAAVAAGQSSTGTVTLNGAAPAGGVTISLSSSNTAIATVPASVTVPVGQTTATYLVTFVNPTAGQSTITASFAGASQAAAVGYAVVTHAISPSSIQIGQQATGTITINAPAPDGGLTVPLVNTRPMYVSTPASVVIPAGATQVTYLATGLSFGTAGIRAQIGSGPVKGAGLGVNATNLTLISNTIPPNVGAAGTTSTGTVTLSGPTPGTDMIVQLSIDNTAMATVPAIVTVPTGQTTATYPVTIVNPSAGLATVTATTLAGSSQATTIGYSVVTHAFSPSSMEVGQQATGTVTIDAPAPDGGLTVTIANGGAAFASAAGSLVIPAGSTQGTYAATGLSPGLAPFGAQIGSGPTITAAVTVNFDVISNIVPPNVGAAGTTSTGTVTLNGTAPAPGVTVALSIDNTAMATVPASVTVAQGQTTATYPVAIVNPSAGLATVTATLGSSTQTATVGYSVVANVLSSSSIQVEQQATGTVTIDAPAPDGGLTVTLVNTKPLYVSTPASVVVPAGATQASYLATGLSFGTDGIRAQIGSGPIKGAGLGVNMTSLALTGNTIPPNVGAAGTTSTGTVTLSGAVAATDMIVELSIDNAALATVPATVIVSQGQTTATYPVTIVNPSAGLATVTATLPGSSQAATIGYSVVAHAFSSSSIQVQQQATGTVTIDAPAPDGGLTVTLVNTKPTYVSTPASVVIPAGGTQATYLATGLSLGTDGIRAQIGSGPALGAGLGVNATALAVTGNSIPPNVGAAGTISTGTVTLSAPAPATDMIIELSIDNPTMATVPTTVTVPQGQTTAPYPVTIVNPSAGLATVTATLAGSTQTATIGYSVVAHAIFPSSIQIGQQATGTVTIDAPAPSGGLTVTLVNTKPIYASVPASLVIPSGATQATYLITGLSFGSDGIRAQIGSGPVKGAGLGVNE